MAGYTSTDPTTGTLLLGANGATLSTVVITGTAGQFSCAAAALAVGQTLTISGTYGGTGSITGYSNPTTYLIAATNGSTTFQLTTLTGAAIVTTAGTPTGLTYTIGSTWQCRAGIIGVNAGQAYDTLLYGVYIQFAAGPPTLTVGGLSDNTGAAASLLVSGSTSLDYFWMPPAPILNRFAAFTFTPSVSAKIWVFTRAYVGPEAPETRITT
jgi:hypothetical protein